MADSFIRVPADSNGKRIDTEQLTVGANTVERERMQIAGAAAAELARVANSAPAPNWYGLVVRPVSGQLPWADVQTNLASAAGVSPDGTTNLDSSQISSGKVGYLLGVHVSSSVPWKAVLQTMADGIASADKLVWFSNDWRAPIQPGTFAVTESAAAGLDGWRVIVTNLDASRTSDFYATFFWDEQ